MAEHNRSLMAREVSARSVHLTHEVSERLRSVLDRMARRYWELRVSPALAETDRKAAVVYFPIAPDRQALDSILGRWRWKAVRAQHQKVYDFFWYLQPFSEPKNRWLEILSNLAIHSKHIDLIPQSRTEERHVTVSAAGGSVS